MSPVALDVPARSRAARPRPSRRACARYGSGSSRGYSMRAMTSAARARPVPGAFDAATSASTRSFCMLTSASLTPRVAAQPVRAPAASARAGRRRPARRRSARAPGSCWSRRHSAARRRAPTRAPSANPRWRRSGAASSVAPARLAQPLERQPVRRRRRLALAACRRRRRSSRTAARPAASRISSISWRSAPEAMAIGTAAAAARMNSAAPGNSTSPACSSSCSRSPLRATSAATCSLAHRRCRGPAPAPRTPRRRRSPGSARSSRPAVSSMPSSASAC